MVLGKGALRWRTAVFQPVVQGQALGQLILCVNMPRLPRHLVKHSEYFREGVFG